MLEQIRNLESHDLMYVISKNDVPIGITRNKEAINLIVMEHEIADKVEILEVGVMSEYSAQRIVFKVSYDKDEYSIVYMINQVVKY